MLAELDRLLIIRACFCRQNKLEEALLFSGQFKDALQALIDWLYRVEPQMAEDQPVHGDIDLILNLIDNHKVQTSLLSAASKTNSHLMDIFLYNNRKKRHFEHIVENKQAWLLYDHTNEIEAV